MLATVPAQPLGERLRFSSWLWRQSRCTLGLSRRNQLGRETIADADPASWLLSDASDGERPHHNYVGSHQVIEVARLNAAA